MGSLSGILQRPVVAAAAVAFASFSTDLHDKLWLPKSVDNGSSLEHSNSSVSDSSCETKSSWVSNISDSKLSNLSFVTRIRVPLPNIPISIPHMDRGSVPCVFYSPVLLNSYQSAELVKSAKPSVYTHHVPTSASSSEVLYRWHLPESNAIDMSVNSDCSSVKSRTVVVLLGWLGAKQKHLNRYAEWYTSRGFHAITFTFPMAEILSYQVGGKAEQHIDSLVNHLADWLEEEHGKNLVFHTFSNTGWLTWASLPLSPLSPPIYSL